MKKKTFLIGLILILMNLQAIASQRFEGGISYDFEIKEDKTLYNVKENLAKLNGNFIDLYYTINFKPLNMLGEKEYIQKNPYGKIKKINQKPCLENYEISFQTGKVSYGSSDFEKLYEIYQKNPNNIEVIFACAIQLKNDNNLDLALSFANEAIEIDPDNALSHFLKGDILRKKEMFKEAADEYIYTTQINPYCADAYYNIAKILELLDDRELALDYYKTAYQVNPQDEELKNILMDYIEL